MSDLFSKLSDTERNKLRKTEHPDWIDPMLATLTHEYFSDSDWIYERKLDGERALAFRKGDTVRLLSRNRKDLSSSYPELVEALEDLSCDDFVADGEIVAFSKGRTSFSRLQKRMQIDDPDAARASGVSVYFYLFDLPYLNGYRLDQLPLTARKKLLRRAIDFNDPLRFTPHRREKGEKYREEACEKGWEGVIAKDGQAPYHHGRSTDWLKFKCARGQALVIGGFTDPAGARVGFGALLVGYYRQGALHYAGKVGTGFDDDFLNSFRNRMDGLERKTSPFTDGPENDASTHFIRPELVGEFGFTEWTGDGRLRHPRFLGLRRDLKPRSITRETPAEG